MPPIKPFLTVPVWADTGDKTQPDQSYISSGFPRGPDKPTRQTMNWVLNYCANGVQYLTSRGIPDWDADQNYSIGDVVRFGNPPRFYSAVANHFGTIPSTDPNVWQQWFLHPGDYAGAFPLLSTFNDAIQNLQNQIDTLRDHADLMTPPPVITAITPSNGPPLGGTLVTITGVNFITGTIVTFGGVSATNVSIVNSSTITATTPPGNGSVNVTVTLVGQSSHLVGGFTYTSGPVVTRPIVPAVGNINGGTTITITGENLNSVANVMFGAGYATNIVIQNNNVLTCRTPPSPAQPWEATVDVRVLNVGGTGWTVPNGYRYELWPNPTAISPNQGTAAGGTQVLITGAHFFNDNPRVRFGTVDATNIIVHDEMTITCTSPPGVRGYVNVVVSVSDQSGYISNGWFYT